jgi:NAD+ synthetase
MKIAVAQINTIPLDIEGNLKKAINYIELAKQKNVKTIIFSGTYLCGGLYFDVLKKFPIIKENVKSAINYLCEHYFDIQIIMGFIDDNKESAILIHNGHIETLSSSKLIDIQGVKSSVIFRNIPDVNPPKNTELIIDFTASISKKNSEYFRNHSLSLLAQLYDAYVLQVNRVGANDELSFDGASRLYGKHGEILARAEFFKEDFIIIDNFSGDIKSMPIGMDKELEKDFSLNYEDDLERTYLSVCQSIRDYFSKNGLKRAVLGLSGGLDSTVCAVLLTDVLGKENVFGISMPSKITTDLSKQDAYVLANNLGINFEEIPISPMVESFKKSFENLNFDDKCENSYTMDNFQARTRATILFGISNELKSCISIATSDKSEAYMGYATINGDMSGGFAPIADITKTKLFALAKWLNKNRKQKNAIPQSVIDKRPGAELAINPKTGKPLMAEEALMPYDFLDEVIFRIEILNQSKEEILKEVLVYELEHNVSFEQKKEWVDKFYKRMLMSTCKGNLMPVYPLVDEVSINKKVYNTPISAIVNFESIKL